MKKIWLILLGVVAFLSLSTMWLYNSILSKEELLKFAVGNLEATLQRRLDLVPNLVNTVKGYAAHESKTLEKVMEARGKAMTMKLDLSNAESVAAFQKVHGEIGSFMSRLMMVAERYPILRASETFRDLMTQLEGTENRINVQRQNVNEAVQHYNLSIRRFPHSLINRLFIGGTPKVSFQADVEAQKAPKVEFAS